MRPSVPEPCGGPPLLCLSSSHLQLNGAGRMRLRSALCLCGQEEVKGFISKGCVSPFKSWTEDLQDSFANGRSREAGWPLCRLASEPPGSSLSCLSSFPSAHPPCSAPRPSLCNLGLRSRARDRSVVLKHPASPEAAIQPLTQVTLRCHIDGHPR